MTDEAQCVVSYGNVVNGNDRTLVWGQAGYLYPFVQVSSSGPKVGIRSLPIGGFSPPVGDIELRVDDNPLVVIAAAEMPLKANSSQAAMLDQAREQVAIAMKANGANDAQIAAQTDALGQSQSSLAAMLAPYTVATGEKADSLLRAMKGGWNLLYRQNLGATVGQTITVSLDGFKEAAAECGL